MNLEESNEFAKHQKTKNKKRNVILALIIICIIALIFLIVTISVLKAKDANTPKLFVNGSKTKLSKTLFVSQDEINYVSVKELAALTGYNYVQGEYKTFAKDNNYCYLKSNYEVISFNVDNNKIKKYLINNKDAQNNSYVVKSENDSMEVFELENDVIAIDDNIYMPIEKLGKIFNISMKKDGASLYINTIDILFKNAGLLATNLKYKAISSTFENVRAISDGMIIAQNNTGNYGVISFDGKKKLDFIYKDIQYIQNTEEFFVYTDDNTVGLLDKDGNKIIAPTEYESLTVFDEINKLYLAGKDGKYGVLQVSKNDSYEPVKEIVTVAFDKVGIKAIELFKNYKIKETESPNLLEDKFIVVLEAGKFGLYDLEGNRIMRSIYSSLGFVPDEKAKKENLKSALVIPKEYGIQGLIIEQDGLYGIFDLEILDIAVPCSLDRVYTKTESGDFGYYMQLGEEIWNVEEYFADYDNGLEEEIPEEVPEEQEEVDEMEVEQENDASDSEGEESEEQIEEEEAPAEETEDDSEYEDESEEDSYGEENINETEDSIEDLQESEIEEVEE